MEMEGNLWNFSAENQNWWLLPFDSSNHRKETENKKQRRNPSNGNALWSKARNHEDVYGDVVL